MWICLATRTPEVVALTRVNKPPARQLNPLHERVLHLERIAKQPRDYPMERDRPKRALGGTARYDWIAKRAGLKRRDVVEILDDASRVLRALL
ncbi:MAG: hypothetical protein K8L99_12410 [Anaerolineae bacterium]|nr:hypothetical protein [Anaerolineae bacterium]